MRKRKNTTSQPQTSQRPSAAKIKDAAKKKRRPGSVARSRKLSSSKTSRPPKRGPQKQNNRGSAGRSRQKPGNLARLTIRISKGTHKILVDRAASQRTTISRIIEIEMRQFNLTLKDLETKPLTKHRKGA